MSFDGFLTHALVKELGAHLIGGKVAKIFYCPFHPFDDGFPELKKGGPAYEGLRGLEINMKAGS